MLAGYPRRVLTSTFGSQKLSEKMCEPHKSCKSPILELAQKVVKKMCIWILGPVGPRKQGAETNKWGELFLKETTV